MFEFWSFSTFRVGMRLKVTVREQEKMRQSIDKKREKRASEVNVTVMFHNRSFILGACDWFFARASGAVSLSASLTGVSACCFRPASFSASLAEVANRPEKRRSRTISSLSHSEKFSAEAPMARSALVVLAATPHKRSPQGAASATTIMTEQRRCAAA